MKLRRIAAVLVVIVFAAVLPSPGQESAKPQHQPQATQSEQQKAAKQKTAEHPAGQPGLSEQLAEASNEAAGEESETAAFKESASVHWLAEHTGLSAPAASWLSFVLNFAVIAVLLILALKSKLPAAFRARTASIQKGMEEARKASEEAAQRLREVEQRLVKLDAEIAEMSQAAEADAAAEEERIRAAADEDKQKLVVTAEQEVAAAARIARRELKAFAAELAVTLAEQRVHVDAKTDQVLVRSFVDQLGRTDGSSGGPGKEPS